MRQEAIRSCVPTPSAQAHRPVHEHSHHQLVRRDQQERVLPLLEHDLGLGQGIAVQQQQLVLQRLNQRRLFEPLAPGLLGRRRCGRRRARRVAVVMSCSGCAVGCG